MRLALDEANKCEPTSTAFCVGCLITAPTSDGSYSTIAMGYSRELEGNTHAEQNTLTKLASSSYDSTDLPPSTRLYTTMEPCSLRLSGNLPCVDRILQTSIRQVYVAVLEPDDFVQDVQGVQKLLNAGREVIVVEDPGLKEECLRVARRGHTT
ncbi:BQ2448_1969 [Microbotryum intermedium]|uniref:BQ2448_1969 protein n=1 Tax=Microbotryum intermedium TaxID=269621 RepID=A0A238F862_9BASI|nr:BQ2448_1969 [Microbotryum intermedium]